MLENNQNYNLGDDNYSNNNNTEAPKAASARENQEKLDTESSVLDDVQAAFLLTKCDRCIVNMWHKNKMALTAEVADFYEVSKQEVVAASNKYSGELQSKVSCQFSPRDVVQMAMHLDSSIASEMRQLILDYVEAWGCESKRDRILSLLEKENIKNWSDRAIAKIANCSHTYVNKLREEVPETIQCSRGNNTIEMRRKKCSESSVRPLSRESEGFESHLATSLQIEPKINRKWTQAEHEEAIAQIEEQHRKQLEELEKRITEKLASQLEDSRIKEVEEEKESYKRELEKALNKIDELAKANAENERLRQQIEDLGAELMRMRNSAPQEIINKQAEKIIRDEYKKQFGDLKPELHLQALAIQPPPIEKPEEKAFFKRILVAALASAAALFPATDNLSKAAAIAIGVEKIEEAAPRIEALNKVGEAVITIRSCIAKVGCSKEDFEKAVSPYKDIKVYVWKELTETEKARIHQIMNPSTSSIWDKDDSWQFNGRIAKYQAEGKLISWGADLKNVSLESCCEDWASPRDWLESYAFKPASTPTKIKVGDAVFYHEFGSVNTVVVVDEEWLKIRGEDNLISSVHISEVSLHKE